MRLLKRLPGDNFDLTTFDDDDPPPYAILSHTWGSQEVKYQELVSGTGRDKQGFGKIRFCGERAAADELQYFWVDTCCINKNDALELSTAINYMFRWYQRTSKCYVYLSDVSVPEDIDAQSFRIRWAEAFKGSRWFTRGWTLQELVAPRSVDFYSEEEKWLGSKISLEQEIFEITKIPVEILRGQQRLEAVSVEERMSWTTHRTTTVKEDKVYCLLGFFGVFLPLIYGEGEAHAKKRLEDEIRKQQNLPPSTSDTTHPSHVIPFPRDPDFVDRGTLLNEVQEKSFSPASRVALVGLGGVGKSQLAIEYCYRVIDQSPSTWLFWVHASNAVRFEQSFREIADSVEIEGREESRVNIFKLVQDWLRDSKKPWLLVLDNVDDAGFLIHASTGNQEQPTNDSIAITQPLREYLPYCDRGSIIITSRNKDAVLKLVEPRDIVAVEPMSLLQATTLLKKKLGVQQSSSKLADLAAALEYMPLAIAQAAAYIVQRAPRCSVAKYLDNFRKSERKRLDLLGHDGNQLRRDWEAKNSIIITWQISFEHIQQTRPSAADLLSLMSFFDRQQIPESLLRSREHDEYGQESDDGDDEQDSDDEEFELDIAMLRNFHFISIDTAGTSFEMHALVQLATRKWLAANGKLDRWKEQFVSILCAKFPTTGEFENWAVCQTLFAHATSAAEQQPEREQSKLEWATLLYRAAWYAVKVGNVAHALTLAKRSMKMLSKVLGQEHRDTLWSMAMVGSAYEIGGFLQDAEELEVQVMDIRKKKLGVDHPDTLTSINNLAMTYWNQGRWDYAEELYVQGLGISRNKLGEDHLDTIRFMNNLALTYFSQARWGEAEELQVQVVEIYKKKLGADLPETLSSMNNLAATYAYQKRYADAEELQVQVMESRKKKLGADLPETLLSMNNLAATYVHQGRYADAEELQVQVMEIYKKKLGVDHPDTLRSIANLAVTYCHQGRYSDAEGSEVQVLEKRKQKLGTNHPLTLMSMSNLACTWNELGRKSEAISLIKECNTLRQLVLRADHPDLIYSLANQARWEAE